jgi:hypothetical protein
MTLQEAKDLATALGGKAPGHLIKSDDWNKLVSVLEEYGAALISLPERVESLEDAVEDLTERVEALELLPARVQQLEDETAPLRENYLLSVSTTAENYLVGQVAELVFKVAALDGSPLPAPMPWLDVVTTWGRLRAAPGFVVRDNAEENALSIQFNNAGELRVQLRSQYTKGFAPTEEASFANLLKLAAGSTGKMVMQVLGESASPQDPETKIAFQAIHAAYDSNKTVQGYADKYVGQYSAGKFVKTPGIIGPISLGDWEYTRATVMAFAKPDSAATSPDPTRGVATVQVNFREWISHWSDDYVGTLTPVLPGWTNFVGQNIGKFDLIPLAVTELDKRAKSEGVLGHFRNLAAMEKVTAQINPGGDTALQSSKSMLIGAVQMQLATGGAGTLAAAGYGQQASVTQQVSLQAKAAQATAQDAASAKQTIAVLETRIKAAEQTGKEISAGLKTIGDGVNKINVAEVADLGGRLNKINLDILGLSNKIG